VAKEKLCFLSGWVNAPDDLARLEVRKGWWIGAYSVLNGELLFASHSLNALCWELKQRPGMVWPVGVCSAATKEELSVPAPVAQSPEQRPRDWPEELRRVRNMDDGVGFLTFEPFGPGAWDDVRQLAQTNDALDREQRINSLYRMHPKAAEYLGLPKLPARLEAGPSATGADTAEAEQPKPVDATPAAIHMSRTIERGRFCVQVIDEIRRIKNLHLGSARSVAEIQTENPDFAVWNVRESLSPEDQATFNHPGRWEAPVGYARLILSKVQNVSPHTIKSWTKAYRRSLRTK
jgi:hypothetical protein